MRTSSGALCVTAVLAITLLAGSASADAALEEHFSGGFPPNGWAVWDYAGDGVVWQRNSVWGDDNWTGGTGYCAEVSSSHSPGLDYATTLESPAFVVPPDALLFFRANYQNFMGNDRFEVSILFGINHITIVDWTSDQGSFEDLPGIGCVTPLPPMVFGQEIKLEFRYRNDVTSPDDDYYIQIDDVIVGDESAVHGISWGAIKALYR